MFLSTLLPQPNFRKKNYKFAYFRSFSNIFVADYNIHIKETKKRYIFRRELFDIPCKNSQLRTVSWVSITNSSDTNNAYNNFIEIFNSLYDECFPEKEQEN